jgi:Mrp family chromosome partitioning ATPase
MAIKSRIPLLNRRSKQPEQDETAQASLVMAAADQTPLEVYPEDVVSNLRHMMTRLRRDGELPERLTMAAALRQEGVSYISRALATVIANDLGVKIGVIELNWWWPSEITAEFYGRYESGLAAAVSGSAKPEEVILPTGQPNLFLVPAGTVAREKRPIVSRSEALSETITSLSENFDHVILDVPAILATSDAIPLASLGTACCMVVHQGVTGVGDARRALDEIDHLPVLGVVMNQVSIATPEWILRLIPEK